MLSGPTILKPPARRNRRTPRSMPPGSTTRSTHAPLPRIAQARRVDRRSTQAVAALPPDVPGATWSPTADKLLAITEPPNEASDLGLPVQHGSSMRLPSTKPKRLDAVPATVGRAERGPRRQLHRLRRRNSRRCASRIRRALRAHRKSGGTKPRCLTAEFAGQMRGAGLYFAPDGSSHCASRDRHAQLL